MKNLIKAGIIAFSFGLIFLSVDTANAQYRDKRREARREYREEVRDARRDYRQDIRRGENRRKARQEYREEIRDARRDYRQDRRQRNNGYYRSRSNRGYVIRDSRRANQQRYRYVYRNGRRYVVRY